MTDAPEPLVGDTLAERYRLTAQVGQGGMARVFRADDTALGRTVAVKVLRPGVEGAAGMPERARSEVTLLASLNHPSLVTLFDAHLTGSPEYLVMEFVDGPTLSARIAEGPMPPAEVAALAAELAEALHIVHASGVVHRDMKPSNVLLAPPHLPGGRSRAKLADFGIALLLDSARLTTPGTIIGTAAYLAPEQVQGGDPAPPADIYALGLVLLEALTGERAYPHTDGVGAALARLTTPPAIPDALGPGWTSLLSRMTATTPQERPTALEVVEAAERLRTAPVDGAPPLPPVRAAVAAGIPIIAAGDPEVTRADTPVEDDAPTLLEPAAARADGDAPTRRYPTAATVAFASAAPASAQEERPRRSRRPLVIGLAVAAVALIAGASIWAASLVGGQQSGTTDPAQTEPTPASTVQVSPTEQAPTPTPTVTTVDDPVTDDPVTDDTPADDKGPGKQDKPEKPGKPDKPGKGNSGKN
ncbi:serine/threonine-protein kinase [Microbacterium sp. NPDC079995]|uniref:serine/threonine-protein kinase n=1 Tax=unclassified Microbacterium TaxID=2609290 RepID=UPI00344C3ADD